MPAKDWETILEGFALVTLIETAWLIDRSKKEPVESDWTDVSDLVTAVDRILRAFLPSQSHSSDRLW